MPFSQILFALSLGPLVLCGNVDILGLMFGSLVFKISLYADGIVLILSQPEMLFHNLIRVIECSWYNLRL